MPKMGFEGKLYYGTAGSNASTLIEEVGDVNINYDHKESTTTVRGDGSAVPIEYVQATAVILSVDFKMLVNSAGAGATAYAALMGAAAAGTAVALKLVDYTGGKGPNFDAILTAKKGEPLGGEQSTQFTAKPTREAGRAAQLYVS